MRAAARQGTSGREARPVMLMLLAASPTISTSLVKASRSSSSSSRSMRCLPSLYLMALVAASRRCRRRIRSSGCIERPGGGSDLVAEVGAEVFGRAELDRPAEGVFELELHLCQVQQARRVLGPELDQEVDVASGAEVVTQGGSVEGKAADAVGAGERGEEGVVEGQARPELHTVMMPHSGDRARVGQGRRRLPSRHPPGIDRGRAELADQGQCHSEELAAPQVSHQGAWTPYAAPAA